MADGFGRTDVIVKLQRTYVYVANQTFKIIHHCKINVWKFCETVVEISVNIVSVYFLRIVCVKMIK